MNYVINEMPPERILLSRLVALRTKQEPKVFQQCMQIGIFCCKLPYNKMHTHNIVRKHEIQKN